MSDETTKTKKTAHSLQYPVMLVHGFGFRDGKRINYWGRIPKLLEEKGCAVFYGKQDSSGTIEDNALFLKERIEEILRETGAEKVNLIAHSKGGLEARYLISTLKTADKVASLTTISTPHRGSETIEKIPDFLLKIAGFFMNVWMRIMGDKNPHAYQAYLSFRTDSAEIFNRNNPDSENVYYQSYAFVMKRDIFLWLPHLIIRLLEGENDGLVTPKSAAWGDFKGVVKSNSKRGISHCDEVDLRRRKFTKKTGDGICDILEVYANIADTLYEKGF